MTEKRQREKEKKQKMCLINTPQDSRIWVIKSGFCKASAEIRLVAYRTSEPKQSTI